MKVSIPDIHDSHGITFTLSLDAEEGNKQDNEVMQFLHQCLTSVHKKVEGLRESALRTYGIMVRHNGLDFQFTEAGKRLAKVDGLWNSQRRDQKYVVLIVEEENSLHNENIFEVVAKRRETCHYCDKIIYGTDREIVTIYDITHGQPQKRLVMVHYTCEEKRQIAIAKLLPYQTHIA